MRKLLHEQQALEVMKPQIATLDQIIENSFADYLAIRLKAEEVTGAPIEWNKRTRANIVHDQIRSKAMMTYKDVEGITAKEWNKMFGVKFGDEIFLRFKKIREFGSRYNLISGIPTKQKRSFLGQGQIEGFPEQPTFVFAGYVPDRYWSRIMGTYMICLLGDTPRWRINLKDCSGVEQGDLFSVVQSEMQEVTHRRVTLKQGVLGDDKRELSNF